MLHKIAQAVRRHKGLFLTVALVSTAGWAVYSGAEGTREYLEKRKEINRLQEENAALEKENQARRERIERLRSDPEEQEIEIRKLNKLKLGERTFMLPEEPKAPTAAPKN